MERITRGPGRVDRPTGVRSSRWHSVRWRELLVVLLGLLVPALVEAQTVEPGEVFGRVREADGAAVSSATVLLVQDSVAVAGTDTDGLGFFRITGVEPGRYELRVQRLGFAPLSQEVTLLAGQAREVQLTLEASAVEVEGLRVRADRSRERIRFEETAGTTVREISGEEIRLVPGVAEADPIRAVQVLPGVVTTTDFSAAFNVRGGSADQNLILLDGVPIFSPFHLGGFFSVFNGDLVERAELLSGGFPADQGGRVSSVLRVETDAGDGSFRMDGGVSLLASRLAVAGGLQEGLRDALGLSAARWRVSARRSYFDLLLAPVFDFPYHLTDLQGTMEAWTPGGDQWEFTAYRGRDVLDLSRLDADDFPLRIEWDWGNDVAGVRWTRPRSGGGFLRANASYSRFGTGLLFPDFDDTQFRSEVDQVTLGADLEVWPRSGLRVGVGVDGQRLGYDNLAETGGTVFGQGVGTGWLLGGYGQVNWRVDPRWRVEAGLRMDAWRPSPGPAETVLSPRLSVKRFLGADRAWAVKASAGRYTQFLHSLRDEQLPLGLDVWVLSGDRAPHVVSDQLQVGVEAFPRPGWQVSLEGYYRDFDGVVTFNAADDPNTDLDDILGGTGTSYGADLLVRRDRGDVTGWIALSWLKAERTFEDVLSPLEPRPDITFPPVFDRRLDVDLVLRLPLPGGWRGGLRWNLGTGVPYTRPVASYAYYQPTFRGGAPLLEWEGQDSDDDFDGIAVLLGDRNGARYPVYHRLDLSVRREFVRSWGSFTPYLDVLNVYNRRNVLFYFFEYEETPPTRSGISMFPLLPSFGVEISFR
jgi:hypothetical protein